MDDWNGKEVIQEVNDRFLGRNNHVPKLYEAINVEKKEEKNQKDHFRKESYLKFLKMKNTVLTL